jgi:hypothetical protein
MLNRQEQYWLECWRRSHTTPPDAMSRRQRRNCLGAMTHGLYAARILNAEERAMVGEWEELVAGMRAEFPQEGDRIDLLVIYWLFLFRAIQADHGKAIERSGRAIRTHLNKMIRPRKPTQERPRQQWGPEEQRAWQLRWLGEIKKRRNIAENTGETPEPHA